MKYTNFLNNILSVLNYDKFHNSLPIMIMITLYMVVVSHICMAAFIEKDVDIRLEALKDANTLLVVHLLMIEQSFNPERSLKLVKLIEDEFLVTREECQGEEKMWEKIYKHQNKKKQDLNTVFKYLTCAVFFTFFGYFTKNFMNYFLGIREYNQRWPTPYLYLIPEFQSQSPSFLTYTYSFQFIILASGILEGYLMLALVTLSTEKVLADFETFYMLFDHLIEEFPDSVSYESKSVKKIMQKSHKEKEAKLGKCMERIVRCHQHINRNFKICADNSALTTTTALAMIANESCTHAFFMIKSNHVEEAAIFTFMFIVENLCLFFIYYNGQRIQNQNSILRKYLADLPWTDKPIWFRQTVHMMMTRANSDIEIRPYGIFVLNYGSFKDIMKLMFSVGNVLYTMKLTSQSQ